MPAAILGPSRAFRTWRRSRPFWGGLLLVLAGVELLFLPLFDVIMRGAVGMVMHMGLGGYAGVLLGCILVGCGLGGWFQPVHRTFYAVIGAVAAVASLPASNFGGFFLAMLLGVVGASLMFGWVARPPDHDAPSATIPPPAAEPHEDSGPDLVLTADSSRHPGRTARRLRAGWRAQRSSALLLPLLLTGPYALGEDLDCSLLATCSQVVEPTEAFADVPVGDAVETWHTDAVQWLVSRGEPVSPVQRAITAGLAGERRLTALEHSWWKDAVRRLGDPPGGDSALPPLPAPRVDPPDTELELPSPPDLPQEIPDLPGPGGGLPELQLPDPPGLPELPELPPRLPEFEPPDLPPGLPGDEPALPQLTAAEEEPPELTNPRAEAATGLRAYGSQVVLRADSARVTAFAYEGTVELPDPEGRKVRMMKFVADTFTATRVAGTITGSDGTTSMGSSSLAFSGSIEIYAAEFSGVLMGVPVRLTPDSAEATLLQLLNTLTPQMPIELARVVAHQPILLADRMVGRIELGAS